jgi:hypothetical protein
MWTGFVWLRTETASSEHSNEVLGSMKYGGRSGRKAHTDGCHEKAVYNEPNDLVGGQHNGKSYEGRSVHSSREWMEVSMTCLDRSHVAEKNPSLKYCFCLNTMGVYSIPCEW